MRHAFALLLAAIACCLTGCGPAVPVSAPGLPTRTLTDGLGRTVTLPQRPGRIVSLSPAATEMLFAIGAGPRVVAITELDHYPPEVEKLPRVGGFRPGTFSTEAVVAQRPDLVLAVSSGRYQQSLVEALAPLGLTVFDVEADTLEQVIDGVRQVGVVVDEAERGKQLAERLRQRVEAVERRVAALPGKRPRVFYLLAEEPLMTAGPASFIGQVLQTAGGDNVFADATRLFPQVSDEALLQRDPDVIVIPAGRDPEALKARLASRPGWRQLRAVREERYVLVAEDPLSRPGPRLVDALEDLARNLHSGTVGEQ